MKQELQKLKDNGKICSIYNDRDDPNKFYVGYVLDCNDLYYLIESRNKYGFTDGIILYLVEKIFKIEIEDAYLKRIERLSKYHKQKHYPQINCSDDLLTSLFEYAKSAKKMCSVELDNDDSNGISGYIKKIDYDNDLVEIQTITDDGRENGISIIDLNSIVFISCDSADEHKLEHLMQC